ncbi:uncharacterized protein ALTATR162_LOCUS9782 [Alternaria atra]|uniref:Uncharacterized protein n=1 Tax=Alternaria atra TaxID=119953 RepID=A0A8J2N963_9PLEO|nr:uncharacterized protein ALTATR162_LOCUS9782 [Alternaria atra]CAG5181479.1 unnamed protein product [Alternaria atra]
MENEIRAQAAARYYWWEWQRFLLFTRQQTVHAPQNWQQTSPEVRRQIVNRVNAALKYEKISEAPEEVIEWRMETLLSRRCRDKGQE